MQTPEKSVNFSMLYIRTPLWAENTFSLRSFFRIFDTNIPSQINPRKDTTENLLSQQTTFISFS